MNRTLIISICLLLFIPALSWGQEVQKRVVSGTLLSQDGEPLPGVAVRIKGTTEGTVTDIDGWYRIEVPLGAVLQYSFIGFDTYEVRVTESNSLPEGNSGTASPRDNIPGNKAAAERKTKTRSLPASDNTERGVAVLSDSSAGYKVLGNAYQHNRNLFGPLAMIRYDREGKLVLVSSQHAYRHRPQLRLEFTTAASRSTVNKLPGLQESFAQGRVVDGELVARGPETGEPFSWGPAISTLSYNANGQLVPRQDGLQPAAANSPYDAFCTGWSASNQLQLFTRFNDYQLKAGYTNKLSAGILPQNSFNRHTLDFSLKKNFGEIEPRLFFNYSDAKEDIPARGANLASVLGSLYTTPPTFDLQQGQTGRKHWQQSATYLNADGSQRSYAPGLADHPYWLLNALPDEKKAEKMLAGLELAAQDLGDFRIQYHLLFDRDRQDDWFGIPPGAAGAQPARLTNRKVAVNRLNSNLAGTFDIDPFSDSWDAKIYAGYTFSYQQESLLRRDGSGFDHLAAYSLADAGATHELALDPYRRTHEIVNRTTFDWHGDRYNARIIQLALTNRMYFSSTLAKEQQRYFLPSANLNFNLDQLDFINYSDFFGDLKLYGSYASSLREAPLLYQQWHFNSLQYTPGQFRQYYEQQELYATPGLLPEKLQKWETGLKVGLFNSRLTLNTSFFHHTTDQLLVPLFVNGQYELRNMAKISTPGLELSLDAGGRFDSYEGRWNAALSFSRTRPQVEALYQQQERVPLAGFSSISTSLIAGQPYGVLWGSRFSRNENGQLLIGADGFPLVDAQAGVVGNPNPDWLAAFTGEVTWKSLGLFLVLDAKKGGDVWNGTQQFLNYYGRSQLTAEQRNITSYIYEGVTQAGTPNQTAIDFYNPHNPLIENRWLRYGKAGVAEEAVEEASWLRLNELRLTYTFLPEGNKYSKLHKVRFSLITKNLFVLTNYSGVDPVNNLFGYQQAAGLDLFNQPNVRSYGFALTINL